MSSGGLVQLVAVGAQDQFFDTTREEKHSANIIWELILDKQLEPQKS